MGKYSIALIGTGGAKEGLINSYEIAFNKIFEKTNYYLKNQKNPIEYFKKINNIFENFKTNYSSNQYQLRSSKIPKKYSNFYYYK